MVVPIGHREDGRIVIGERGTNGALQRLEKKSAQKVVIRVSASRWGTSAGLTEVSKRTALDLFQNARELWRDGLYAGSARIGGGSRGGGVGEAQTTVECRFSDDGVENRDVRTDAERHHVGFGLVVGLNPSRNYPSGATVVELAQCRKLTAEKVARGSLAVYGNGFERREGTSAGLTEVSKRTAPVLRRKAHTSLMGTAARRHGQVVT